jgi:NAD(P)-dependent dehydrogenase (short-subunit alcohol dehydrogenase family)
VSNNKVALVTGANKGLGFEIARQLGKQGITVLIGARDAERGEAAAAQLRGEQINAQFIKLDVTNANDIRNAASAIESEFGKLDILVNNAGINLDFDPAGVSAETLRQTYEINVIAPYTLTQALLPLIHKSEAGRIVNHSSMLGSIEMIQQGQGGPWGTAAYTSSKAALNMLTVVQANALSGSNIKVNAAHPGWVKTDLGTDAAPMETPEGAETAVRLATLPADGPTGGFFHKENKLPW